MLENIDILTVSFNMLLKFWSLLKETIFETVPIILLPMSTYQQVKNLIDIFPPNFNAINFQNFISFM